VVLKFSTMTTAAKPTFDPAKGGTGRGEKDLSALSKQYSSRDLPSHTKLKHREHGQATTEELKSRDFRRDLEERERQAQRDRAAERRPGIKDVSSIPVPPIAPPPSKKQKVDQPPANLDADDPLDEDSDVDSDEEDDTAELLAELNRIKKERATEQVKKEAEKRAEDERIRTENILSGNPLLNRGAAPASSSTDFKVKRRWDDDVVFKNCAKGDIDKDPRAGAFINDCLRSEFHKKFMEKYVK